MKNLINRLALAKMLMKFGEVNTDKGNLTYEGQIAVDLPVFIEDENGELVPAPDGEYKIEDGTIYVVAEGKIAEIKTPEVEDKPAEEPVEDPKPAETPAEENLEDEPANEPDPRDAEIETLKAEKADLEAKVNELSQVIADRDKEIEDLKAQLNMSAAQPAHKQIKEEFTNNNKENKVLKYFN